MKAFISRGGGIDSLRIEELPAPGPLGPGQVRVALRAASLNYRDLMALSGALGPIGPQGFVPCSDGAGEIVEVAPDVKRLKVGDRVVLTHNPEWISGPFPLTAAGKGRGSPNIPGVMREEAVIHHNEALVFPAHLSFEEAAGFPCAAVTAWHALCGAAPLFPGMTVLLQGGGGVSVFALQFAKLFGARVLMTSSSLERCARLATLGADETINYRDNPEWHKAVRDLTSGVGVDLTIDIGGAETIDRSLAATRIGGRVALVGLITGLPNTVKSLFSASVDITPVRVGSRDDFEAINRAVAFHALHPVIAARYDFAQLPAALRQLQAASHLGKIVIGFG
jgi:NADPH:quinone reductase-like Zn-dependent oxidoreductase